MMAKRPRARQPATAASARRDDPTSSAHNPRSRRAKGAGSPAAGTETGAPVDAHVLDVADVDRETVPDAVRAGRDIERE
jgi:hypothetical protein